MMLKMDNARVYSKINSLKFYIKNLIGLIDYHEILNLSPIENI